MAFHEGDPDDFPHFDTPPCCLEEEFKQAKKVSCAQCIFPLETGKMTDFCTAITRKPIRMTHDNNDPVIYETEHALDLPAGIKSPNEHPYCCNINYNGTCPLFKQGGPTP